MEKLRVNNAALFVSDYKANIAVKTGNSLWDNPSGSIGLKSTYTRNA
jgi:hypothetical protein